MNILCPITEYETKIVKQGKGVGNTIKTRLVICFDKWCWSIALQTDDKEPVGQSFFKGFVHLIPYAICEYKIDKNNLIQTILKTLNKSIPLDYSKAETWKQLSGIGKAIDNECKTNYNLLAHEGVYDRMIKENANISSIS